MSGMSGVDAEPCEEGGEPDLLSGLDPRAAAQLLAQTQQQARRALDFRSPGLSLGAAVVALVAFGAIWLSVRGQHPYRGPTPVDLIVLYAVVALRIAVFLRARHRATAGVTGRSLRQQRAEAAVVVAALVAVYAVMTALALARVSDQVVYGIYPGTATLIVLGTVGAASAAARAGWPEICLAIAIMLVAAGSAFAGPRGVWLSDGVGLCAVLALYGAAQAWRLRRPGTGT